MDTVLPNTIIVVVTVFTVITVLFVVVIVVLLMRRFNQAVKEYDPSNQSWGSVPGQDASAVQLLGSGQRVRGVLKSFAATGSTARSLGKTPSNPQLLDAPRYLLEVQLQLPHQAPVIGRNYQAVPVAEVPNLAVGQQLTCVVGPADPANRFVVQWERVTT